MVRWFKVDSGTDEFGSDAPMFGGEDLSAFHTLVAVAYSETDALVRIDATKAEPSGAWTELTESQFRTEFETIVGREPSDWEVNG
jgi:hypothetical protein